MTILYRNDGKGFFDDVATASGQPGQRPVRGVDRGRGGAPCSRGYGLGDFDNDGDIDILVVNLNQPPSLLRNDLRGAGHWIKVKLVGVKSNRGAIGPRVTARYGDREPRDVGRSGGRLTRGGARERGHREARKTHAEVNHARKPARQAKPASVCPDYFFFASLSLR